MSPAEYVKMDDTNQRGTKLTMRAPNFLVSVVREATHAGPNPWIVPKKIPYKIAKTINAGSLQMPIHAKAIAHAPKIAGMVMFIGPVQFAKKFGTNRPMMFAACRIGTR